MLYRHSGGLLSNTEITSKFKKKSSLQIIIFFSSIHVFLQINKLFTLFIKVPWVGLEFPESFFFPSLSCRHPVYICWRTACLIIKELVEFFGASKEEKHILGVGRIHEGNLWILYGKIRWPLRQSKPGSSKRTMETRRLTRSHLW